MKKRRTNAEIKDELLAKRGIPVLPPPTSKDLLSTGSTMLNLACSGKPQGGFAKGRYHFIVGDSTAGKTWVSMTCLAEAAASRRFDHYRFIFDAAEHGALMDVQRFFGNKMFSRLEPPQWDDGPVYSTMVEEFYYNLDDAFDEGRPFIYVLDSMDVLSSKEDISKFKEHKKASMEDTESKGSYGARKAKENSERLRVVIKRLAESESILIVINQSRDNLGPSSRYEPQRYSGGRSLRFYAAIEMWLSIAGTLKKEFRGVKYQQGIMCRVRIKKNRLTGQLNDVTFPIYHTYGIDDLGSCIDFMTENKFWMKTKSGVIAATDLDLEGRKETLIRRIEADHCERDLRIAVGKAWSVIQDSIGVDRVRRYQ